MSESVLPLIGMIGVQDRQPGAFGNFDLWRAVEGGGGEERLVRIMGVIDGVPSGRGRSGDGGYVGCGGGGGRADDGELRIRGSALS